MENTRYLDDAVLAGTPCKTPGKSSSQSLDGKPKSCNAVKWGARILLLQPPTVYKCYLINLNLK